MSSENTRVLIAGINQFINTVVSYINISNRDLNGLLGGRTATFSDEEGRITYALIVEGLLETTLKCVDTRSSDSKYPTATAVAELLLSTTKCGTMDSRWSEDFEMMEVYGVSFSDADPRKRSPINFTCERYSRPAALSIVFQYIAISNPVEFRMATHTC